MAACTTHFLGLLELALDDIELALVPLEVDHAPRLVDLKYGDDEGGELSARTGEADPVRVGSGHASTKPSMFTAPSTASARRPSLEVMSSLAAWSMLSAAYLARSVQMRLDRRVLKVMPVGYRAVTAG